MTCPRCQGLMVRDLSCDLAETQGMWVSTTRCMNCGHVTDPTIENNRIHTSRAAGVGQPNIDSQTSPSVRSSEAAAP
jgi:hypothetical protein